MYECRSISVGQDSKFHVGAKLAEVLLVLPSTNSLDLFPNPIDIFISTARNLSKSILSPNRFRHLEATVFNHLPSTYGSAVD